MAAASPSRAADMDVGVCGDAAVAF
jgi:hypothetical protein